MIILGCKMMNEKILIVDDQYGIRILLNEVFHKEGYQTFQAANGIQALDIVTKRTARSRAFRYENPRHGRNRNSQAHEDD